MATVVGACDCICCCDADGVCRYDVSVSVQASASYSDPGDYEQIGMPPTGSSSVAAWTKTEVMEGECNRIVFSMTKPCVVNYTYYADGPGGEEPPEFCQACPDDLDPFGVNIISSGCGGPSLCEVRNIGGACYQITTLPLGDSQVTGTILMASGQVQVQSLSINSPLSASTSVAAHLVGSATVVFKGKSKTVNLYSSAMILDATNGAGSVSISVTITQKISA